MRIGRYRITDTLGEGGMGVVYAALDEQLERPIAVKVLRHESAADPTARERFWREARLAASVNHPHICQLYEIGESDGQLFMAMERLEGEPLAARLSRGAIANRRDCADWPRSARGARGAASPRHHAPGPQTVERLSDASRRESARLRRLAGPDGRRDAAASDQPGAILGTPKYMAPEQVLGERRRPPVPTSSPWGRFCTKCSRAPPRSKPTAFTL